MDKKYLKGLVEKAAEGGRTFKVIMSTGAVDRMGETVNPEGWQTDNYMKNPTVLWAHNYSSLPIGKMNNVYLDDEKRFIGEGEFAPEGVNELADSVAKLFELGFIKAVSVGFIPLDMNGVNILQQELLELSFVPVPANQEALALAHAKGFTDQDVSKLFMDVSDKGFDPDSIQALGASIVAHINKNLVVSAKSVVPYADTPVMEDKEAEWNESEAVARIKDWATKDGELDEELYSQAFAYFDGDNYLLPHHDIVDGELQTHWQGVVAAMGQLLSDGHAGIPDEDVQGVYDHLAKHYEQYSEEPPAYDAGGDAEPTDEPKEEDKEKGVQVKAGRVLSEKNRNLIKSAVGILKEASVALEDLLASSDAEDSKGLSDNETQPVKASQYGSKNQAVEDAQSIVRLANNITNLILAGLNKKD